MKFIRDEWVQSPIFVIMCTAAAAWVIVVLGGWLAGAW